MMYSLYGPNSSTLILAPDSTLRQLLANASQDSSGPMIDRIRDVPAGNDLYVAVNVTSLRPIISMGLAAG